MVFEATLSVTDLLLIVLITVTILSNIKKNFKENVNYREDFLVVSHILENIIEEYKILTLQSKIEQLQKQHDLNPQSKTNSLKLYGEKYNELIKDSAKEIFRLLSKDVLKKLKIYYNEDALILHIIYMLKK